MNTQHFQYAVTVARTGSITQAAEELSMAQPNLSKAIRELESSLGIEIFLRTPKGMVPTAQGEAFLRYAHTVLEQVGHMEALGRSDGASERFCVALPNDSYVSDVAIRLIAEQPISGEISLREMDGLGALREVQEGRADMAIIRHSLPQEVFFADLVSQAGLCTELLWEYDAKLTLHTTHPLAQQGKQASVSLDSWPELYFGSDDLLRRSGNPDRRIFFEGRADIGGLLKATKGYLWLTPADPESLAANGLSQLTYSLPGDSSLRWRDVLVYPKGQPFSSIYSRFIDLLYEARNAMAFE